MSGQSSSSRPQQNDEGTVGGGARRRRRGKRSGPGPSQDVVDSTPALQEPRIPLPDVLPPECIPSSWFDLKVNGLPASTSLTPWSLFDRSSLISSVEKPATDSEAAAVMKHMLHLEARHATLLLAQNYENDVDRALKELQRFIAQNTEKETFTATNAVDHPGSRQSGAVRRYRNTPRIFGCVTCNVRLPSRRSLEKHFLTHDKASLTMAVCTACGFPTPNATMLEWHVFLAHRDVARGLVRRHWPRLRRNDHNDCSFCCPQHSEMLYATWCVCPPPLVENPSEGYYIPGTVLPPLLEPTLVAPPPGFPECRLPRPVEAYLPGYCCCCRGLCYVQLT